MSTDLGEIVRARLAAKASEGAPTLTDAEHLTRFGEPYPPRRRREPPLAR